MKAQLIKKLPMIKDKNPIVFQAMPRWDHPYASTALNLAKRLSNKQQVFYVERPYTWKDVTNLKQAAIQNRIKFWLGKPFHQPFETYPNLIYIVPKPQLPINFLPEGDLFQSFNMATSKAIWETVDKVLEKFNVKSFTYINSFDPLRFDIHSKKKVLGKFYHCVDNIEGERYIAKHGTKAEKIATRLADAVITTSEALKTKYQHHTRKIHAIENGVDFKHFDAQKSQPMPEDMGAIKGIKLLYIGNIGLRLDYEFIEKAALKHPELNWVLIGPRNPREFEGESLLHLPNVHFLGKKSYDEIPAYIHHADACVLPFKCNELTKCIYPLKINEYFACGKPVLSSQFADLKTLASHIHFYENISDFEQQLNDILLNHSESAINAKIRMAKSNDWHERTKQLEKIISQQQQKESLLLK